MYLENGVAIIELVDSICRDSVDTQYILIQKHFSKSSKQRTYHRVGWLYRVVDSICRDSADTQYMLLQKNLTKSPKQLTYKLWRRTHPVALKSIAKVPNQKVARRPKSSSSSSSSFSFCTKQQHFSLSIAPAHRFFQVWRHTRRFELLTEELWLPLRRHVFFTHVHAHKSPSNEM